MNKRLIIALTVILGLWGNLQAQSPPEWTVDPHDYEYTMTLTAELTINQFPLLGDEHLLGAFAGDDCHGVVSAVPVADDWLYMLLIYGNLAGEELELRVWDAVQDTVLIITQAYDFEIDAAFGTIDVPVPLNSWNLYTYVESADDYVETDEDESLTIFVLQNDTFHSQADIEVVPLVLPQIGSIIVDAFNRPVYTPDPDLFGPDSFSYELSNGYMSDTAWVHVNVTPVNDPPENFDLVYPANEYVIWIHPENLNLTLTFDWETAEDVDGDDVVYYLEGAGEVDFLTTGEALTQTEMTWTYAELAEAFGENGQGMDFWEVRAFDGQASRTCSEPRLITINTEALPVNELDVIPGRYELMQNFPNPFNGGTTLRFAIPDPSACRVDVFDLHGAFVVNLHSGALPSGWGSLNWNGMDGTGNSVPGGIYFCRLVAGEHVETIKMHLLK